MYRCRPLFLYECSLSENAQNPIFGRQPADQYPNKRIIKNDEKVCILFARKLLDFNSDCLSPLTTADFGGAKIRRIGCGSSHFIFRVSLFLFIKLDHVDA